MTEQNIINMSSYDIKTRLQMLIEHIEKDERNETLYTMKQQINRLFGDIEINHEDIKKEELEIAEEELDSLEEPQKTIEEIETEIKKEESENDYEIIFQIRKNIKENDLEFVKKSTNQIEGLALLAYLKNICNTYESMIIDEMRDEYEI